MAQPVTVDVHEVIGKESKTSEKEVVKTTRLSTDRMMEYRPACMYESLYTCLYKEGGQLCDEGPEFTSSLAPFCVELGFGGFLHHEWS